nr:MAG TPA: hypothetical protein [Caudoviricetes sp.]
MITIMRGGGKSPRIIVVLLYHMIQGFLRIDIGYTIKEFLYPVV